MDLWALSLSLSLSLLYVCAVLNWLTVSTLYNLQISVTPLNVHGRMEPELETPASDWLSAALAVDKEKEASPVVAKEEDASDVAEDKEAPAT